MDGISSITLKNYRIITLLTMALNGKKAIYWRISTGYSQWYYEAIEINLDRLGEGDGGIVPKANWLTIALELCAKDPIIFIQYRFWALSEAEFC